jgi:hypothetical protein
MKEKILEMDIIDGDIDSFNIKVYYLGDEKVFSITAKEKNGKIKTLRDISPILKENNKATLEFVGKAIGIKYVYKKKKQDLVNEIYSKIASEKEKIAFAEENEQSEDISLEDSELIKSINGWIKIDIED